MESEFKKLNADYLTINKNDLSYKYLENGEYKFTKEMPKIDLFDIVVVYYLNETWKIIPLYVFMKYPVIFDDGNTISVCPYTLSCVLFEGKYYPTKYLYNSCLVLQNEEKRFHDYDSLIPIYHHNFLNTKKTIIRHEVEIKTLKNSMSQNIDALYFRTKKKINKDYKIDDPLFRVIQYRSCKTNNYKYSIIIGKNNDKCKSINFNKTGKENLPLLCGFDMDKSGYTDYFQNMDNDIRNKIGFIMPVLSKYKNFLYPNAKIINLN
jgi:hypothetical protein